MIQEICQQGSKAKTSDFWDLHLILTDLSEIKILKRVVNKIKYLNKN